MDDLEGFPEKTCTVDSYKRWILFPLIFKSVPATTTHQHLVKAQQELGAEAGQKARVTPVQQCHHRWGAVPQGWAWQAELASSNRACWHSQARWSNEDPARSLKDRAGDKAAACVQRPPRRQGQRQNWVQATSYVWGIFPEGELPAA